MKRNLLDERHLAEALARGEQPAQDAAYRAYYSDLTKTGAHILGYADPEVEDAVQEAFMAAFENAVRFEFRGPGSLPAWLRQICVNKCYSRWRQRDRLLLMQSGEMEGLLKPKAAEDDSSGLEKAGRLKRLHEALRKMGEVCRKMIELRDLDGGSYASVSKTLKIPMGTVMSRLYRCREALKKLMKTE
jgi:RNA polymerase sigma-70 factor, ECF subfamily